MNSKYPLPRINDLFDQLRRVFVFSKIDLRIGYHEVKIKKEDIHKTAFMMGYGHYEFNIVPFRVTNSRTIIMCLLNNVLRPYLDKVLLIFVDDILVYSQNEKEHDNHLRFFLQLPKEHNFLCQSQQVRVLSYSGSLLGSCSLKRSSCGSRKDQINNRMAHVLECDRGQIIYGVGYCLRFIQKFSNIGHPITALQRKGVNFQ